MPYHPVSIHLMVAGVTHRQLADHMGLSKSAVTFQLEGRSPFSQELLDAIEVVGSPELARKVRRTVHHAAKDNPTA